MDALTLLRDDHREVLAMLEELERQPTDGTSDERADRKRLVTELIMASSAHEAVEEQYLWPSVVHWLEEGRDLAAPALEQEQQAKTMLDRLEKLEPGHADFESLVGEVINDTREHIAYEENEVWPMLRDRLAPGVLDEIGDKMALAKKAAPTRPHPHTPPNPSVLKSAGVAAAAADKVRDALSGRGKGGQEPHPGAAEH